MRLREGDEAEGRMTKRWADEYSEEYAFHQYGADKPRQCQNPHCGHDPIFSVYILRNPISGDVKEIGSYCKQRWNRLHGFTTEDWFEEYDAALRTQAALRSDRRLTSPEMKQIEREVRKKSIKKQAEQGKIFLSLREIPIQNFHTKEEAERYASDHGGYLEGLDPTSDFYHIYVRREPTQKEEVLRMLRKGIIPPLNSEDHPLQDFHDEAHAEKYAKAHGGYSTKVRLADGEYWRVYVNPQYKGEY